MAFLISVKTEVVIEDPATGLVREFSVSSARPSTTRVLHGRKVAEQVEEHSADLVASIEGMFGSVNEADEAPA